MEIYCKTAVDGRIVAVDLSQVEPDWERVELPPSVSLLDILDHKLIGGQLVHEPFPKPEPKPTAQEQLQASVDYLLMAEMVREGLL